MREDTGLRFALARNLMRMSYGQNHLISRDDAVRAWPPTGDCDRSMEAGLRAMAIAARGGHPEESLTTEQRIRRDLDDSFAVQQDPICGDYIVQRKLSACPFCGGRGWKAVPIEVSPLCVAPDVIPSFVDAVAGLERCDHSPS